MPAGENAVQGKQGFQTTQRPAAVLEDMDGFDELPQVPPHLRGAITARREAIERAQDEHETACARGVAELLRARYPLAARAELQLIDGEDPAHYVVTGLYARADGGRLPIPDDELNALAFDNDDMLEMTAGLRPAGKVGDRYMDRNTQLLGQVMDIDEGLKLPVTTDERLEAEAQPVIAAIRREAPDAVAVSFLTSEYDDGTYLTPDEVLYQRPDGSWESWSAYNDDLEERDDAESVRSAISEMNDIRGPSSAGCQLELGS